MLRNKRNFIFYFLVFIFNSTLFSQGKIEGKLEKWNKITIHFNYKEFSENDEDNPFLNYRLNVSFKNGDEEITIPGFLQVMEMLQKQVLKKVLFGRRVLCQIKLENGPIKLLLKKEMKLL